MTWLQVAILGVLQGLTEFLPVSSSGHLVLAQHFFGLTGPMLAFDVSLHLGTLLAVVLVFHRQVVELVQGFFILAAAMWRKTRGKAKNPALYDDRARFAFMVILGTVPTGIIGVALHGYVDTLFGSAGFAASMLLVTGLVLALTRLAPQPARPFAKTGAWDALVVGVAQGVAVLPGISRSGSTIAVGLFLGMDRDWAARFSFILSIPAIMGAVLLELVGGSFSFGASLSMCVVGALVAAFTGYAALLVLLRVVRRGALHWFAPYCLVLGAVTWICLLWA